MAATALIAIDWGTTSMRAYWMDGTGAITDTRSAPHGIQQIRDGGFAAALTALVGTADDATVPRLASGMIGSRQGWLEAPYVPCPARFAALVDGIVTVPEARLHIVPGVSTRDPHDIPDVMRGEETQLVGSGVAEGVVVMPGTHCKWVNMNGGRVESFATFYTGEMNSLIRGHSSVGALLKSAPDIDDIAAYEMGLNYARAGAASWLHDLFVLRASVVTGQRTEAFVSTVLAGWLLGCEISAALTMYPDTRGVVLVASQTLVPWYERATRAFGLGCDALNAEQVTTRGLWRVAQCL